MKATMGYSKRDYESHQTVWKTGLVISFVNSAVCSDQPNSISVPCYPDTHNHTHKRMHAHVLPPAELNSERPCLSITSQTRRKNPHLQTSGKLLSEPGAHVRTFVKRSQGTHFTDSCERFRFQCVLDTEIERQVCVQRDLFDGLSASGNKPRTKKIHCNYP